MKRTYKQMEKRVKERTAELVKSNRALQAEIVERKKIEKEILEITHRDYSNGAKAVWITTP